MISTRAMQKISSIKIAFKVCSRCDALWTRIQHDIRHPHSEERRDIVSHFFEFLRTNPQCRNQSYWPGILKLDIVSFFFFFIDLFIFGFNCIRYILKRNACFFTLLYFVLYICKRSTYHPKWKRLHCIYSEWTQIWPQISMNGHKQIHARFVICSRSNVINQNRYREIEGERGEWR